MQPWHTWTAGPSAACHMCATLVHETTQLRTDLRMEAQTWRTERSALHREMADLRKEVITMRTELRKACGAMSPRYASASPPRHDLSSERKKKLTALTSERPAWLRPSTDGLSLNERERMAVARLAPDGLEGQLVEQSLEGLVRAHMNTSDKIQQRDLQVMAAQIHIKGPDSALSKTERAAEKDQFKIALNRALKRVLKNGETDDDLLSKFCLAAHHRIESGAPPH